MNSELNDSDRGFMRRAIALAGTGEGRVSPNPPVGCVIVRDNRIIAEGWHDRLGGLHAEAMALKNAGAEARGARVFVTLSPCTSHGRQPPCATALIRAGVAEVIVAATDPNPGNADGAEALAASGIPVRAGLLCEEAEYAARGFFKVMRQGLPYLALKYAMTMDGKIAAVSGDSRWVSGPESREMVQDMRSRHDAIIVGSGTALADDPALNLRGRALEARGGSEAHPQPVRVVVDSHCRLPPSSCMLHASTAGGQVIVACAQGADPAKAEALTRAGAEVVAFETVDGRVRLEALMRFLARRGVNMVLCEGGGELAAGLIREKLVDEVVVFLAAKIIGGRQAPGPVGGEGFARMSEALPLRLRSCEPVGGDLKIVGVVPWPRPEE